ncbi:MAG: alpha/beta hydrolase [Candidatus Rokuibacteriota bacterium]|nr:MAG: alpha/beta hydrolase [Candidatus Rokubacteria bacterium]
MASGRDDDGVSPLRGQYPAAHGAHRASGEVAAMSQAVFRHYDKRALDAEYNNRAKVKNAMEWMARYGGESARVRAELPMRFDVPYGSHHAERLDVFLPERSGPAPVHVFIHGGYWHRLDKADFSFVARAFREAATVVVNYALVPSVDLDELVRQVRASIAWVHANAKTFGGDPDRITASGHSAGGHLVAMLLATDWAQFGAPADAVKAGCAISGLYDLEPIRLCYLNDVLALSPEAAQRNSPVLLKPRGRAPLVLTVGADEGPEYLRQTNDLAAAWRGHGAPVEIVDAPGFDHFSIIAQLERADSTLARTIRRQMGLA